MLQKARFIKQIIRDYGLSWVLRRGFYEFQLRSGIHRLRFRQREWDKNELARWVKPGVSTDPEVFFEEWKRNRRKFFFEPADREDYGKKLREILGDEGLRELVTEAEEIGNGKFCYFFKHKAELGIPPDWHLNPFTGGRADPNEHWTQLPMFSSEYGDMKFVWEPGRFASAFLLARASWASGRDFASTFWFLIESWKKANHPNCGAHWKCGQEASLRLMAWYFALHAFLESRETTPERFAMLAGIAAAQADRVERDHVYSHLQKNNHAMSEGVGLYLTGLLFPQFKKADAWRHKGLRILEEEGIALIKSEGTFRQKSHNYHRLMVHLYMYAGRIAELNGDRFSEALTKRLKNASDYLFQVQDAESGRVPNFGANDGALVFPANSCDYQDYRPVCSAGHYFFEKMRIYENGPWDEDLLWLFGPSALTAGIETPDLVDLEKQDGGIYTLRGENSWAFTHCESFKERPGQADALHFDLWWRGINITPDAGSYLYFCDPPWKGAFSKTDAHSTVTVDDQDQLETGPRFMKTNWHSAKVNCSGTIGNMYGRIWEGEHDGYCRFKDPVIHRRSVLLLDGDRWIVIDDVIGKEKHHVALNWTIVNSPYETIQEGIVLSSPEGKYSMNSQLLAPESEKGEFDVVSGGEDPRGWISRYYAGKEPVHSAILRYSGSLPCRFLTTFCPNKRPPKISCLQDGKIIVDFDSTKIRLYLAMLGDTGVVRRVERVKESRKNVSTLEPISE